MSEILRKWLRHRLGLVLDYNLQSFEEVAFDGSLLAKVLHNYGIINDEGLSNVKKTTDPKVALNNLLYLQHWLKTIGVDSTDKLMYEIARKDESKAILLFYQIYVALNTQTKLNCLIEKNVKEAEECFQKDFMESRPVNVCQKNPITKSTDFEETKELLKWHKNKYADLLERCNEVRSAYVKCTEEKLKKEEQLRVKDQILGVSTRDQIRPPRSLVKTPEMSLTIEEGKCVSNEDTNKEFLTYLNQKLYRMDQRKKAQARMHQILLSKVMEGMTKKEDDDFKNVISTSLLKQSSYEKQITAKLLDIRHQKNIMLENLHNQQRIINKRKEHEFVEKLFQQNTNLTLKERRFIQNLKRQQELHRRLWAERCAKKYAKHYESCHKIVLDLIDLSLKSLEYQTQFNRGVPPKIWKEWASLFTTNQPIFDLIDDPTKILDLNEDTQDEILTMEMYRQDGLDESDLNDYLYITPLWEMDEAIGYYNQNCEAIQLGNEIFGFIIHRLLKLKYPCPKPHYTPDLPQVNVRAALVGLKNSELIETLQQTLNKHHIAVIDPTTVINFSLKLYLSECDQDVDQKLSAESEKSKKSKKSPSPKKDPRPKKLKSKTEETIEKAEKEAQTPKVFPGEELHLSEDAKIGKAIYETLHLGLELNDLLMIDSLIVYLKKLRFLKGWVLINFPATVTQAYLFEQIFTGRPIPESYKQKEEDSEDEDELTYREDVYTPPEDLHKQIRLSRLLPNPQPACPDEYVSYLTSFVHMFIKDKNYNQNPELSDPYQNQITRLYSLLNICSTYIYDRIDYTLLEDLIYLLSKDEAFAKQLYEEILQNLKKNIQEKKKSKEEIDKKGKNPKGDKPSKKEGSSKSTDSPKTPEDDYVEPAKPGEINWEYVELPLVEDVYKYLASAWQQQEEVYIGDFKEIFFRKRVYQNQIIPYVSEIETHMQAFIERPDLKQEYLHDFQKIYNDIDTDLREDDEFKAELHNKLSEFRDKLWCISDDRMKECEEERQRIINDNWFVNHCMGLAVTYGKAFQLELDRCMVSLQIQQDYYSAMALKIPIEQKLLKCSLNFESYMKNSSFNMASGAISRIFGDTSQNSKQNPFVDLLSQTYDMALNCFNVWKNTTQTVLKNIQGKFSKKEGKVPKKGKKSQSEVNVQDFDINDKIERMVEEWGVAMEGEVLRTRFRLKLILEKGIEDINENLYFGEQMFHEIYDRIDERYHEEVECVDTVCQLFARAIEACEPIQARLVIDGTEFYIDENKLFYMDEPFKYEQVKEKHYDVEFTIASLTKLALIFLDLAPEINMPESNFVYLLQDMVVHNPEDDYETPLPVYWQLLSHKDVPKLVKELYGDCEYINWKDFIVWNLLLPYPTEYELLEIRHKFVSMDPDQMGYVNLQQFFTVFFWFEDEFDCDDLRIRLIKKLLSTMFHIVAEKIDYMSMLFYFSKDVELIRGVSKAISLFCGDFICWDPDIGRRYMKHLWHQKKQEEEHLQQILVVVNSVMDFIFQEVSKQIDTVSEILGVPTEHDTPEEESLEEEEESLMFSSITDYEGEEARGELPNIIYFLDFEVLINVMTTAFPWRMQTQLLGTKSLRERLEELFEKHRNKFFDNRVFAHEFLNDPEFMDIVSKNSKFLERIPSDVVRKLIEVCTCEANKDTF